MTTKPEEATLTDDERQRVEVWTRVMGYHRPVSSFNTGKKGEFAERKPFFEPALHDRIHPTSGLLLAAKQVQAPMASSPFAVVTDIRISGPGQ
jgi:hypothetical protein